MPTIGPHALRTLMWYIDEQGPFIFYPRPCGHGGHEGNLVLIFDRWANEWGGLIVDNLNRLKVKSS